ncbi:MAG: SDR family NAD(P)-dependent oxidoreductase [Bacteroidetes bacterium]|nr:SDR family NAD(P)-dependent oxidoreductase [Bacteroidota bacterium]
MKKIILITGASSGFGHDVSNALLEKGHTVYAVARGVDKMADLAEKGAKLMQVDVTSDKDVRLCVERIVEKEGRIDVLFNNAGYGSFGTIEDVDMDNIFEQFNVNVYGLVRMIKAVLPYMRKERSGLIINTSSVVGKLSMPCSGYYSATKHAVESLSDALRYEVRDFGIKVSVIEPGPVKTGFERVVFEKIANPSEDYKSYMKSFVKAFKKLYVHAPTTSSTVKSVVHAVESKNPKIRYRTTLGSKMLICIKYITTDRVFDRLMRRFVR